MLFTRNVFYDCVWCTRIVYLWVFNLLHICNCLHENVCVLGALLKKCNWSNSTNANSSTQDNERIISPNFYRFKIVKSFSLQFFPCSAAPFSFSFSFFTILPLVHLLFATYFNSRSHSLSLCSTCIQHYPIYSRWSEMSLNVRLHILNELSLPCSAPVRKMCMQNSRKRVNNDEKRRKKVINKCQQHDDHYADCNYCCYY